MFALSPWCPSQESNEHFLVLFSFHLLILSLDHSQEDFIYEVIVLLIINTHGHNIHPQTSSSSSLCCPTNIYRIANVQIANQEITVRWIHWEYSEIAGFIQHFQGREKEADGVLESWRA